jgi:hypothetical protein
VLVLSDGGYRGDEVAMNLGISNYLQRIQGTF